MIVIGLIVFTLYFVTVIAFLIRDFSRQERERKIVARLCEEIKSKIYDIKWKEDFEEIRQDILDVITSGNKSKYKFVYSTYITELALLFVKTFGLYERIEAKK